MIRIGVDFGGTKIEAAALDAEGRFVARVRVPTPKDYEAGLEAVLAAVTEAEHQAADRATRIGVGGPGSVSPASGLMRNANSTQLNGRPFPKDLARVLGRPVRYANDANCLALSEAVDGAGAGEAVVFAAILGTGTGAGIAVHGRVLTGPNGLAGEWGHNPLPWPEAGEPALACYCGRRGCVETLVSGPGLARDHAARHGGTLTAEQVAAAAAAGDAACAATLERHAERLARALAGVINLLDPDVIVLGGGVSKLAHLYERVPALWSRWVFSGGVADPVRTRLLPARHGDSSGVRGAAWIGAAAA